MPEHATPAATAAPLDSDTLRLPRAYWRAAHCLSLGQIYLLGNPLFRQPLRPEHVKPRLLGRWGTTPGLKVICARRNRVIRAATSMPSTGYRTAPPLQIEHWGTPLLLTPRRRAAQAILPPAPAIAPFLQPAGRAPRRRQPSLQPAANQR